MNYKKSDYHAFIANNKKNEQTKVYKTIDDKFEIKEIYTYTVRYCPILETFFHDDYVTTYYENNIEIKLKSFEIADSQIRTFINMPFDNNKVLHIDLVDPEKNTYDNVKIVSIQ